MKTGTDMEKSARLPDTHPAVKTERMYRDVFLHSLRSDADGWELRVQGRMDDPIGSEEPHIFIASPDYGFFSFSLGHPGGRCMVTRSDQPPITFRDPWPFSRFNRAANRMKWVLAAKHLNGGKHLIHRILCWLVLA